MQKPIIYFDNAATTFPKPETVYRAADSFFRHAGNPGRGAHKLALEAARSVFEARNKVASFLGIKQAERLIFTPSCTYSLNMVLKGLCLKSESTAKPFLNEADTVLVSAFEHNAVMRPLKQLHDRHGIKVACISEGAIFDPFAPAKRKMESGPKCRQPSVKQLENALNEVKPKLCLFSHASNVTGDTIDLEKFSDICLQHKIPLAVDAAQTAGRFAACLNDLPIAFWCASAHKALMGQPGLGLLYVNPDFELGALIAGGTGSASEDLQVPRSYPDHLEPGTPASVAIATLAAAVEFIEEAGAEKMLAFELDLMNQFLQWCANHNQIRIYGISQPQMWSFGDTDAPAKMPVISLEIEDLSADTLAQSLDEDFGIAIRPGLHCAAVAHRTLGTIERGLARISFGYFNTSEEVEILCEAISSKLQLASGRGK